MFFFLLSGMTLEVLGTLAGAAIQGQIVASAHRLKHCQGHNSTINTFNNSGGADVIRSLVRSEEYMSHAVRKTNIPV